MEKNGWYDNQPCVDIASLKTLYEKPKGKNSYKEKSAI